MIISLATMIRNDLRPESEECFTICIYQVDEMEAFHAMKMIQVQPTSSVKQLSVYKMTMAGLEHMSVIIKVDIIATEPFAVALVNTVYIVHDSVGVVNVCVNDIFDEPVNV